VSRHERSSARGDVADLHCDGWGAESVRGRSIQKPERKMGGPTEAPETAVRVSHRQRLGADRQTHADISLIRSMTNKEGNTGGRVTRCHNGVHPKGTVRHPVWDAPIRQEDRAPESRIFHRSSDRRRGAVGRGQLAQVFSASITNHSNVPNPGQLPKDVAVRLHGR